MKNLYKVLFFALFFYGCGLTKKIEKSEKSVETSEKTTDTKSEKTSKIKESEPTQSELVLDIQSLSEMIGDFTQRITSGNGNESVIEKKDGKIHIKNTNAGSKETETTSETEKTETIYNSKFVINETKKFVARLPWWFWVAGIFYLLIIFRKLISQILVLFFPALGSYRMVKVFLGTKQD